MIRRWIPFLTLFLVLGTLATFFVPQPKNQFDLDGLGHFPVLHEGRVKPIDTVARSMVLTLKGKQTIREGDKIYTPISFLLTAAVRPQETDKLPLFMVKNPTILGMLGKQTEAKLDLTFNDFLPYLDKIEAEAELATQTESKERNAYQRDMIRLKRNLVAYTQLKNTFQPEGVRHFEQYTTRYMIQVPAARDQLETHGETVGQTPESAAALSEIMLYFKQFHHMSRSALFRTSPPLDKETTWRTHGDAYLLMLKYPNPHPSGPAWTKIITAYESNNVASFNQAVTAYQMLLDQSYTQPIAKLQVEYWVNKSQLFYVALVFYLVVGIAVFANWLIQSEILGRSTRWLLVWTFFLHTIAIGARMWIVGRPPVTNLYTSAVFVGWVAIALGILIERFYKNGFGAVVSGIIGFSTLIIAHHLSLQGDTLEMMQAVLDSNFWLATHVVTICIGYGAVFLAGFLAIVLVIRGIFTTGLDVETRRNVIKMIYAILCFALFFSAIGTILGGIWADQSWGRFWGWDPKENGAMIIVLWIAAILHARWDGMMKERGLLASAIFGNIVTAFSWFGVNMLGVGLHSYGFMDQAFVGLVFFVLSQLFLIWLTYLPERYWRSSKGAL